MAKIAERLSGSFSFLKQTAKKFGAENGSMIAAAVSFYATLSLLPLLLLGVAILGYIVGSSDKAFDTVTGFFNSFMPTSTFITDTLRGLVSARGAIGLVGIIALLWTGSQFFVTLQTALNDIWEVTRKPGFIKMRLKAILLVILFGLFLVLSIVSSSIVNLAQNSRLQSISGLIAVFAVIVGLLFATAMYVVVYKFGPNREVRFRSALVGAIFAGIVWTIAKELYRLYLTHFADFNKLYGSLGSVVILIMWIYYSAMIMIFGAELAYASEYGPREEPEEAKRMDEEK